MDDREAYEFSYALYLARQVDREAAQMIVEAAEAGEINLSQAIEILSMYSYRLNASLPKDRDTKPQARRFRDAVSEGTMRLLTISIAGFAALTLLAPVEASAQEDVTAPVLLDFTISPTIFDAGPGPVDITVCATAQDDLSGMNSISVRLVFPDMSSFIPLPIQETAGELIWSNCRTSTIPQFFLYGEYIVEVQLLDVLVNGRQYRTPPSDDDDLDLCAIGTCLVENLQLTALPDFDNDGVTDIADNCPNDSNPNQEDADADLIGDVCDPFPNNHDNEQAQCD